MVESGATVQPGRNISVGAGFSRRGRTKFGFLGGRPGPPAPAKAGVYRKQNGIVEQQIFQTGSSEPPLQ